MHAYTWRCTGVHVCNSRLNFALNQCVDNTMCVCVCVVEVQRAVVKKPNKP